MTLLIVLASIVTYFGIAVWMYPTLIKRWARAESVDAWGSDLLGWCIAGSLFWPINTFFHFVLLPLGKINLTERSREWYLEAQRQAKEKVSV